MGCKPIKLGRYVVWHGVDPNIPGCTGGCSGADTIAEAERIAHDMEARFVKDVWIEDQGMLQ